jgi:shikimate 5-dehydrogenase
VDATPVRVDALPSSGVVYDLVYNPRTTRLLREAAARGCETISGLEMLVSQARQQFAWWTGVWPPADTLRRAAIVQLDAMAGNRSSGLVSAVAHDGASERG